MLVGRRDDLVPGLEVEAGEDDVAAVGCRRGERDLRRIHGDELRELLAEPSPDLQDPLDVPTPDRPRPRLRSSSACIASTVVRARGPALPACR